MRQRISSDLSGVALPSIDPKPVEETADDNLPQFSSSSSFSNLMTSIRSSLTSLPAPLEHSVYEDDVASPLFLTEADIHTYLRLDRISILFHFPITRLLGMFEALYWSDFSPNVVHSVNLYVSPEALLVAGTSELTSFPMQLILPFTEIVGVTKNTSMPSLLAHVYALFSKAYQVTLRTTSGTFHSFSAYSQTDAFYDLLLMALKTVTLPAPLLRSKSGAGLGAGMSASLFPPLPPPSSLPPSSSSSSHATSSTPGASLFDIHPVSLNTTFRLVNNAALARWQAAYPTLLDWLPCLPLDEPLLQCMYQGASKTVGSPDDPGWDPSEAPITLGIPDAYRARLWPLFARSLFVKQPHAYSYYVSLGGHARFRDEIEKDIGRSLPEHPAFQSPIGCQALRRVLNAFAQKNPRIGYAQAMNLIASLLLLSVPEEDAFWILCHIVEGILPDHYSKTLIGSVTDQKVFERLLDVNQPKLAQHLKALQVEMSTLTISWFVALFLSALPFRLGQVVLDFFLLRKEVFLFQLALAIFQMNASLLLQAQDEFQVMDIMKQFFLQFQGQEDEDEQRVATEEQKAGTINEKESEKKIEKEKEKEKEKESDMGAEENIVKNVNLNDTDVKEENEDKQLPTPSSSLLSQPPLQSAQEKANVSLPDLRVRTTTEGETVMMSPRPSQSASYLFRTVLLTAFQRYGHLKSADIEKLRLECRFSTTHRMEDDFRVSQLRTLKEATLFQEQELNRFYTEYQWILLTFNQPISGLDMNGFRIFFQVVGMMDTGNGAAFHTTATTLPGHPHQGGLLLTPTTPTTTPISSTLMGFPSLTTTATSAAVTTQFFMKHQSRLPSSSFITPSMFKAWPFHVEPPLIPLPDLMFQDACAQFHVTTLTLSSCVASLQFFLKDSMYSRLRYLFRLHDIDQDQQLNGVEFYSFLFNLVWLLGGHEWDWHALQFMFMKPKKQSLPVDSKNGLKSGSNIKVMGSNEENEKENEKENESEKEKEKEKVEVQEKGQQLITPLTHNVDQSKVDEVDPSVPIRPFTEVVDAIFSLCVTIGESGGRKSGWLEDVLDFQPSTPYPLSPSSLSSPLPPPFLSPRSFRSHPSSISSTSSASVHELFVPFHTYLMGLMSHPYLLKKLKL